MSDRLVVIGASLGGLAALQEILGALPPDFPMPIAIAQHRHKTSNETLAVVLRRGCALKVKEAEDKQKILPGVVYLAPADYHLQVDGEHLSLSLEGPVLYSRPSIDVLFETAAGCCGSNVVGVILTGANADGAAGARRIKERGGVVIVQDPATAEAPAMPLAAIAATSVDQILPVSGIAPYLMKLTATAGARKS